MSESQESGFWAIVELMGHVKVAGYVTEEERFGCKMGRIDVPGPDDDVVATQYFGGSSIYRITPVTEDVARGYAHGRVPAPIQRWELPELNDAHEEIRRLQTELDGHVRQDQEDFFDAF